MRRELDPQRYFNWSPPSGPKIVRQYEDQYNRISEILDQNQEILTLAHKDLEVLTRPGKKGRKATYTSENALRALIVHTLECTSLRDTMVRLYHSAFLQGFARFGPRQVMDFTFLDKCFKAIQPQTWLKINDLLRGYAIGEGRVRGTYLRTDTTLVEANIHYPTDTSLLWDCWRVLSRLLKQARDIDPTFHNHRFHDRKVKALYIFINRSHLSKPKTTKGAKPRKLRRAMKKLVRSVTKILGVATEVAPLARRSVDLALVGIGLELEKFCPPIRTVVQAAERAQVQGEVVPAKDRIFSIFEPHVELIKRGKSRKPVEFGHMVVLGQSKEKFITQYDVMPQRVADCLLTEKVLENHKEGFGSFPDVLAGDTGFCAEAEKMESIKKKVKIVAIPRRVSERADKDLKPWYSFRAGIEGSISVLKRAFGLLRCRFRGFKSFAASIGLAVFSHNLVLLATWPKG